MAPTQSSTATVQAAVSRFNIPRPRSIAEFIIYPSRWSIPNFKDWDKLMIRIKTNLLHFQTNYLILSLLLFALITILSMRTLLTGVTSAVILVISILFFFEHIPQARQIKQNHPSLVIIAGILLVIATWHALHTILFVVAAGLAPIPLCLLHAAFRSSSNLVEGERLNQGYFLSTPMGQLMQMVGLDPVASSSE